MSQFKNVSIISAIALKIQFQLILTIFKLENEDRCNLYGPEGRNWKRRSLER
jgi:hypothetical protein